MNIIRRRGWELPESQVTPEHLFLNRRALLAGAAGGIGALSLGRPTPSVSRDVATLPDPTADLYPAKANTTYPVDRPLTEEKVATTYNNFYEFGGDKAIASRRAGAEDQAVDGEDRRHGREADGDRHRRPDPEDAA